MNREMISDKQKQEDVDGDTMSDIVRTVEYEEDKDYEDNDEYSYEDDYQNDLDGV